MLLQCAVKQQISLGFNPLANEANEDAGFHHLVWSEAKRLQFQQMNTILAKNY